MMNLNWNASLELGFAPIDHLHHQLVDQMAVVDGCDNPSLVHEWAKLVDAAQTLFEQENGWMNSTHFSSAPSHSLQHRVVLNLLREALGMARAGQFDQVRTMSAEFARWLSKHVQSQDAALALHLRGHPEAVDSRLH